jgi:alpha-glucosidase (family GH31 glycosyl hydrolase)
MQWNEKLFPQPERLVAELKQLGRELMVAPVFNPDGVRTVYFPVGRWVDYWTREVVDGPGYRTVEVPLDRIPLYVRLDSLLPTIEPAAHTSEESFPRRDVPGLPAGTGRLPAA